MNDIIQELNFAVQLIDDWNFPITSREMLSACIEVYEASLVEEDFDIENYTDNIPDDVLIIIDIIIDTFEELGYEKNTSLDELYNFFNHYEKWREYEGEF